MPLSLDGIPVVFHFVGRESELQQIEDFFQPIESAVQTSAPQPSQHRKAFVLYGMGGIGKTQLCVKYICEQRHRYSAVLWLHGSSHDSLKRSLFDVAATIRQKGKSKFDVKGSFNADEAVQEVLSWLSLPENFQWLLIFDNVDWDSFAKVKDS